MMMDGRGRGGYGRGPDGRGGYGRFGRGGRWGPEDDYDAPRNWNYGEPQVASASAVCNLPPATFSPTRQWPRDIEQSRKAPSGPMLMTLP